jgi:uncharacterized repeat protein (TIGR01451 family)
MSAAMSIHPRIGRAVLTALTSAAMLISTAAAPHVALAAVSPICPQVATTVTCTYLSGDNTFNVPAGVTTVHVVAIGGKGSSGWGSTAKFGRGAIVQGDIVVTPGAALHAIVGGNGQGRSGGANGGGNGGRAASMGERACGGGAGGGGGASDVRTDESLDSRIVVAGGGGGAGCWSGATPVFLPNAGAGGDAGADGYSRPTSYAEQGEGGQAGCGISVTSDCGFGGRGSLVASAGQDGTAGTPTAGGDGGGSQCSAGGGGGAGYRGGGAGGSATDLTYVDSSTSCPVSSLTDAFDGGGGGGGSSLVPVGGTVGIDTTGQPKIVISFSAPALPTGPHATLMPASVNFGDVVVGQQAASQAIHLTSSGLGDLDISSIGFDGPSDGFVLGTNDCGTVLPSQWSCTINVGFSTISVGPHSATVSIQDDAADSPQTVSLTAKGVGGTGALASIAPASLDFGDQAVGTTSAARTVTVTNVGTVPFLPIADVPVPTNGFAASTCVAPLAPGDACQISVTFTPSALGPASAQLVIFDPMPNSPQVVGLAGNGVPAVPAAHLDKTALSFGNQALGGTTASQTVTLSNTGTGALSVTSALIGGSNAGDFGRGLDTCTGVSVAPGSSCSVSVSFTPTVRGARSATLRFTDNAGDSPQDLALSGSGVAPVAQLSVTSIDFGNVEIGTTSAHRRLTITNTGDAGQSLFLSSETITGTDRTEFDVVSDTCVLNFIAAGSSCTIDLTFTPSAAGLRSATFTISDNAVNSPQTVSLTGTGVTPTADLAVSISASPNPVKTGSKLTYTITIFNAGPSTALSILINDSLSSQSTFVSAKTSRGSCVTPVKGASGVVSCSLGSLASVASQPIQIEVTVIARKDSITNTVMVSAATSDPNLANNTASITTRVK